MPVVTASEAGRAHLWNPHPWSCVLETGLLEWRASQSPLERGITEGENPVSETHMCPRPTTVLRVALLGSAAQRGRYTPSKARYERETDSGQVP